MLDFISFLFYSIQFNWIQSLILIDLNVSAKVHLREALVLHEESQRLQRMCRDLKAKQALAKVLKRIQESTVEDYNGIKNEDDFRELDPPDIIGKWRDCMKEKQEIYIH